MKKRLLSALLAIALMISLLPATPLPVQAATSGDYTYKVVNGEATITGYTGAGGDITIPSRLGGYPVTTIGDNAFSWCESLTTVTIPISVTTIEDYAFWSCHNMTSVTIGDGITTIGRNAFEYCTSLTGITIPDSVTTIGDSAFSGCGNLTSVYIGNNVTTIGNEAFWSCGALTNVTIPDSVTLISENAFGDCISLTGFWVSEGNSKYSSDKSGVLFNKDKTVLIQAPCMISGSYSIPNSVTAIGNYAFQACKKLTSVTIPNSVTNIGFNVFAFCQMLSSITIPSGITGIAWGTFYDCTSLRVVYYAGSQESWNNIILYGCDECLLEAYVYFGEVPEDYIYEVVNDEATITGYTGYGSAITIPSNLGGYPVTAIGEKVFYNNTYLTSVTIPDGVTTIGEKAFYKNTRLTSVIIPDGVLTIGNSAFYDCDSLASITIPDSVTSIGDSVFYNCDDLTGITIPDSVLTIGNSAFYDCDSLASITIPDSVTSIGDSAFRGCGCLTALTIPDSVTVIGDGAFSNCIVLNGIWVDENNSAYSNDDSGVLFNKDKTTLIQVPGTISGSYTIPDGVTTIGNYAFYGCSGLTGVTIPNSVTTIGNHTFYNCQYLTSVKIPDGVTSIGDYAFYYCRLTELTIPDSVTTIGNYAFYYCQYLTSVRIPNGVTSIGDYAFSYCASLTSVTIPDSVTTIGNYAFFYCIRLISATIPDSITTIGQGVFNNCHSLIDVIIPDSVTTIGMVAFYNCTNLTTVTIPDCVTTIDDRAFNNCPNLTIYGADGSYAQQYAEANSIPFVVQKNHEASNGEETFATLQDALDAYEGGTIQLQADVDSVTVSKNAVVDLNGFRIASVKMTSATLKVLDSKTDDYTIADGDYGKIAFFTGGTVTPAAGYIAIWELDGVAYHKVSLEITDMTLRSANAGVYYKCAFNGDEMVADQVTSYGVALSLKGTPEIGASGTQYSTFTEFATGANTPSTLLKNVMKETNTESQNNRNANMRVYGRPYIQIGERYIYGETVSRSFREQVELVDTIWNTLTADQQAAVQTMYRIFQNDMAAWTIPNMKNSI